MTNSTHTYTATLLTDPEVVLQLDEDSPGSISLDTARSPHVEATLRLKPQSQAVLDDLDPRLSSRIRIDVEADFPSGAQSRSFDLGIREQDDEQRGAMTVSLKSDEAILEDYVALQDDETPLTLAGSLRDVVDYVLNTVIPGAALEPSPADDADVTPIFSVTNLVPNPNVRDSVGNWIAGGSNGTLSRQTGLSGGPVPGVTTFTRTSWSGNSGSGAGGAYSQSGTVAPMITAQPFKTYSISCWVRASVAKPVRLSVQVFAQDGSVLSAGTNIAFETLVPNAWTRLRGTIRLPANAARIGLYAYPQAGSQWSAGNTFDTLGWLSHEGTWDVESFDAGTVDSAYIYEASGDVNDSASTREPYPVERNPESLVWSAGVSAMEFIAPLVQSVGLRLVCDEERKWTLRGEGYTAAGSLNVRFGVNLIAGGYRISRDSGLWFDAALRIYRWRDRDGIEHERVDSFALNEPPGRTSVITIDAAYPGPGRAEYAVRRAQGRGREVTATVVSDWRTRTEQPTALRLEGSPAQIGKVQSVAFDLSNDRMRITDRTVEIPEGAIDLLSGTVDDLSGTVNAL